MLRTKKYTVKFYHRTIKTTDLSGQFGVTLPPDEERRCTVARLYSNTGMLDEYVAVCNPEDNFNRATGRKNALNGVLSYLSDKNERREIWQAYQQQFPGRKK